MVQTRQKRHRWAWWKVEHDEERESQTDEDRMLQHCERRARTRRSTMCWNSFRTTLRIPRRKVSSTTTGYEKPTFLMTNDIDNARCVETSSNVKETLRNI